MLPGDWNLCDGMAFFLQPPEDIDIKGKADGRYRGKDAQQRLPPEHLGPALGVLDTEGEEEIHQQIEALAEEPPGEGLPDHDPAAGNTPGADGGVSRAEVRNKPLEISGRDSLVSVRKADDIPLRLPESPEDGAALAQLFGEGEQPDSWIPDALHYQIGGIGAAVAHHDNLDIRKMLQKSPDHWRNPPLLVMGRYHQGKHRKEKGNA